MLWWAELIAFALLALSTAAVTRRQEHLFPVGATLVCGCALSNVAMLYLATAELPAAFTVVEVMIISVAFTCWLAGGSRLLAIVVAASAVSIASNLAITFISAASPPQIRSWIMITNICFVVECLATIAGGFAGRVGTGDRHRWTDLRHRNAATHARDQKEAS